MSSRCPCCDDADVDSCVVLLQVSKQAKEFLEFVYEEPLLDVQQLNPCLYEHCEPLSTVLRLRQQLQSLRAYLFSCRATVAEDLRRRWVGCRFFMLSASSHPDGINVWAGQVFFFFLLFYLSYSNLIILQCGQSSIYILCSKYSCFYCFCISQ